MHANPPARTLSTLPQDGSLGALLGTLRQSGKKVFLATNSLWDYTSVVMNFLLSKRTGQARNADWLKYFDVVITGAAPQGAFRCWTVCRKVDGCASVQAPARCRSCRHSSGIRPISVGPPCMLWAAVSNRPGAATCHRHGITVISILSSVKVQDCLHGPQPASLAHNELYCQAAVWRAHKRPCDSLV